MKKIETPFTPLISYKEKERFVAGLGVLEASGVEAGGRIAEITETAEKVAVQFSYYATRNEGGLSLRMNEKPEFDKKTIHRIPIECLVLEESPESFLVLFPDPKKIVDELKKTKI